MKTMLCIIEYEGSIHINCNFYMHCNITTICFDHTIWAQYELHDTISTQIQIPGRDSEHHIVGRPDRLEGLKAVEVLCGEGREISGPNRILNLLQLLHHFFATLAEEDLTCSPHIRSVQ